MGSRLVIIHYEDLLRAAEPRTRSRGWSYQGHVEVRMRVRRARRFCLAGAGRASHVLSGWVWRFPLCEQILIETYSRPVSDRFRVPGAG